MVAAVAAEVARARSLAARRAAVRAVAAKLPPDAPLALHLESFLRTHLPDGGLAFLEALDFFGHVHGRDPIGPSPSRSSKPPPNGWMNRPPDKLIPKVHDPTTAP